MWATLLHLIEVRPEYAGLTSLGCLAQRSLAKLSCRVNESLALYDRQGSARHTNARVVGRGKFLFVSVFVRSVSVPLDPWAS